MNVEKLKNIKAIITDVDGVLTNGFYYYDGEEIGRNRHFNVKDLYGFKLCKKAGIITGIISAGDSVSLSKLIETIPISFYVCGAKNKEVHYQEFKSKFNLKDSEICYIGDDYPDLDLLVRCGYSVTPSDGMDKVKEVTSFISSKRAGEGCFRDIVEKLLDIRGIETRKRIL